MPDAPLPAPLVAAVRAQSAAAVAAAWIAATALPVILLTQIRGISHARDGLGLLLPALLMLLPAALLRRHPLPALALLLAGAMATSLTVPSWQVGYIQAAAADIAIGYIGGTRSHRVLFASAAFAIAAQVGCASYYARGSATFTSTIAALALGTTTAAVLGASIRQRREHGATLRAQATAQAITAERLRIARELHDVIAHSVGVIAIQAGMGSRVIETQPAEARAALRNIEDVSRQTLAGLRRTLGALRRGDEEPEPTASAGLADLDRLRATAAQAGVNVEVRWRGSREPLPPEVDLSAFRIIQEAVTNVVRHAHAPACQVTIEVSAEEVTLEIVDRGRGGKVTGPGHGITGMRERADLLHGRFTAGPHPAGGFRVTARLPVPARTR